MGGWARLSCSTRQISNVGMFTGYEGAKKDFKRRDGHAEDDDCGSDEDNRTKRDTDRDRNCVALFPLCWR